MNILHTETLKRWGGQQKRILQEMAGLAERGHRMLLACHRGSVIGERAAAQGFHVVEMNMSKSGYLTTVPALVSLIRREKVDLVCTHSSVDSWAGGIAARLSGRKLVRVKHNIYPVKTDLQARLIYSAPHGFITVNQTAADVLAATGFIDPGKIRRIYGSIDTAHFDPRKIGPAARDAMRQSLGIPPGASVLGNTSGFTGIKGQRYLLSAFQSLLEQGHDLYLLLAGRLGMEAMVLDLIPPDFHHRVILSGHRTDVPEILSAIDIFVFPSVMEAFGNSLVEAMSMALPVVASDLPSFREFMTPGVDGLLVPPADAPAIAEAVAALLGDRVRMQSMGVQARNTVGSRFSPETMMRRTEEVYREVLDGR